MYNVAIIGAGINGVTTAYALNQAGVDNVVVLEAHRYPSMETSYANGGQLSACNAEVWTNLATMAKAVRWIFKQDAPLLLNLKPSWHKLSWLAEFALSSRDYRKNSIETAALAIRARERLIEIARTEGIPFDLEQRGILHVFRDKRSFDVALHVNKLLASGGLDRHPVTPSEIRTIEPALKGDYYGGMYTPSDASGDIHKFTRRLASVCEARGTTFLCETESGSIVPNGSHFELSCRPTGGVCSGRTGQWGTIVEARKLVICAGTHSRSLASMLSDRINIYPVKGYSVTCHMEDEYSRANAPVVSLLDEEAKIVTSRLGSDRFRVAGTAELNGFNYDIRADRIEPLKRWIRSNFPAINTSRIVSWAGLRPMMPNMMPVVRAGRRANVFYNTGHGHLGWTLSAATADLVAQLVKG